MVKNLKTNDYKKSSSCLKQPSNGKSVIEVPHDDKTFCLQLRVPDWNWETPDCSGPTGACFSFVSG